MSEEITEEIMFDIQGKLVSLDVAERYFCCDLEKCLGECCIEGDAGAPITEVEKSKLEEVLPAVWDELLPAAQERINESGVSYVDEEGDLVTQIVDGRNCVFTTYGPGGMCLCALEKAFREGKTDFRKPASCALYPLRVKEYDSFTAINYHRWKICRCAELAGKAKGIRLYEFMEGPLTEVYGKDFYDELKMACEMYLEENDK